MSKILRVVAGVSGSGTTADYLAGETYRGGTLEDKVCIAALVPSRPDCGAIELFKKNHPQVPVRVINPKDFNSEEKYAAALTRCLESHAIDVYGQYGLVVKTPISMLPKNIIVINQHPVPIVFGGHNFYGLTTHEAVLAYMRLAGIEQMYSECITHQATEVYDDEESLIIQRCRFLLKASMTAEQAQERTLRHEWICQAQALLRIYEEGWPLTKFPGLINPINPRIAQKAKEKALEIRAKARPVTKHH